MVAATAQVLSGHSDKPLSRRPSCPHFSHHLATAPACEPCPDWPRGSQGSLPDTRSQLLSLPYWPVGRLSLCLPCCLVQIPQRGARQACAAPRPVARGGPGGCWYFPVLSGLQQGLAGPSLALVWVHREGAPAPALPLPLILEPDAPINGSWLIRQALKHGLRCRRVGVPPGGPQGGCSWAEMCIVGRRQVCTPLPAAWAGLLASSAALLGVEG